MTTKTRTLPGKTVSHSVKVAARPNNAWTQVRNIQVDYDVDAPILARMLGVKNAALAGWEKSGKVPAKQWTKVKRIEELLAGLSRVMRQRSILKWLQTANEACVAAGAQSPLDLMEKGSYDKIEAMIYFLESGTPS